MERIRKPSSVSSRVWWTVAGVFAAVWTVITVFPFIFMVLNSFKEQFEILTEGVFSWPQSFYVRNYATVFQKGIGLYFWNSIIVCAVSVAVALMASACAAYPISRLHFKPNRLLMLMVIACMSIPVHVTLIPIFKMAKAAGTYDTLWSLIGPDIAFALPISIFILAGFMEGIPRELEEAAEIDGCGRIPTFFRIILPLSQPSLATLAIYNGVEIWNDFIFSYTLTQSLRSRTLPLAIWDFQGRYSMNAPMVMAVLTISFLPMLALFILFQDKLMEGMTLGAVKG